MKKSSKKKSQTWGTSSGCAIASNEIDRISKLSDDILHYILSFVDIVDVVRLSVLSRRWKSLWITTPYLNFDIDCFSSQNLRMFPYSKVDDTEENFQELINWVLMSQSSTKIARFYLNCDEIFDEQKITRWIHVAVRRNVQELALKLHEFCIYKIQLSNFLITCESLRVLRLMLSQCELIMPSHSKFKQLTTLYLEEVVLSDDDLIRKLISKCSFLEDLSLIRCIGSCLNVLDISSSSLKCLTITTEYYDKDFYGFSYCEIRISCPNLMSFTYMGGVAEKFCLDNISSLDYICIDIFPVWPDEWRDEWPYRRHLACIFPQWRDEWPAGHLACKILEQIDNIRVLELRAQFMQHLFHALEELQCFSTTFHQLKFLNLSLAIDGCCAQGMFLLLKHCPNLESLSLVINKINEDWRLHGDDNVYWLSRLKSLRLINFGGKEHELGFVKFMLKNGLVLEKFIIIWSKYYYRKSPRAIEKKVLKFPRASSLVKVKIVL